MSWRSGIPAGSQVSSNSTTRLTVRFGSAMIDTTVTRDAAAAEWKPNYQSWTTSKVAILQLCAGTCCLVIQLFYVASISASLRSFLADPEVRFVGISVGEDAAKLAGDYGLRCAAPVDLEACCNHLLGLTGLRRLGLKGYAKEWLGLTMEKPRNVTMSRERHDLDVAQIQYACIDAYVSYKLGERVLGNN